MSADRVPSRMPLLASRWMARALSLGVVGIILAFVGEGRPKPEEWLLIMFFPVGLLVGLVLAWWREITGALVALGSMAVFYGLCYAMKGNIQTGPYFALLASPAALFLIAGMLARGGADSGVRTVGG